jgi:hypothetical protein
MGPVSSTAACSTGPVTATVGPTTMPVGPATATETLDWVAKLGQFVVSVGTATWASESVDEPEDFDNPVLLLSCRVRTSVCCVRYQLKGSRSCQPSNY